jgi:hypothetical protein
MPATQLDRGERLNALILAIRDSVDQFAHRRTAIPAALASPKSQIINPNSPAGGKGRCGWTWKIQMLLTNSAETVGTGAETNDALFVRFARLPSNSTGRIARPNPLTPINLTPAGSCAKPAMLAQYSPASAAPYGVRPATEPQRLTECAYCNYGVELRTSGPM